MTGYKTKVGADTVFPFSGNIAGTDYVYSSRINENASLYNLQAEYTVQSKGSYLIELVSCEGNQVVPVITVTKNSETISDYISEDRGKIPNAVAASYFMQQKCIKLDCEAGDIIKAINSHAYVFVMIVHKL